MSNNLTEQVEELAKTVEELAEIVDKQTEGDAALQESAAEQIKSEVSQ